MKGVTKDLINTFRILNGAKCFSLGIFPDYLVIIPVKKYNKYFSGTTRIESGKSIAMSEKSIENITQSNNFCRSSFITRHEF